jgi:hypothetical protein
MAAMNSECRKNGLGLFTNCLLADAVKGQDYIASMIGERVIMKHWWDDADRGKRRYSEKTPSKCHFVYQKSHIDWPTIIRGLGKKIFGISCPVTILEPRKDGKKHRKKE